MYNTPIKSTKKTITKPLTAKSVTTDHIVEMIRCVLSACIQKGVSYVSKKEIKKFYKHDNFEECFKATEPRYLMYRKFKDLRKNTLYGVGVKRYANGRTMAYYELRDAITRGN